MQSLDMTCPHLTNSITILRSNVIGANTIRQLRSTLGKTNGLMWGRGSTGISTRLVVFPSYLGTTAAIAKPPTLK